MMWELPVWPPPAAINAPGILLSMNWNSPSREIRLERRSPAPPVKLPPQLMYGVSLPTGALKPPPASKARPWNMPWWPPASCWPWPPAAPPEPSEAAASRKAGAPDALSSSPDWKAVELDSLEPICGFELMVGADWALAETATRRASPETKHARRKGDTEGEDMVCNLIIRFGLIASGGYAGLRATD